MSPREHPHRREATHRALKLVGASLVAVLAIVARDAHACICEPPEPLLLSPIRTSDVPVNTKVRVALVTDVGPNARVVLRAVGGAIVEARTDVVGDEPMNVYELTPAAPLAARTRYEVSVVDPKAHPPAHVFAMFESGAGTKDSTAPRIHSVGSIHIEKPSNTRRGCSAPGPWISADIAASDPERPDAKLLFAVSLESESSATRILDHGERTLFIGAASMCRQQGFPLPKEGAVTLAIAAIDEAGNRSPPRKLRADFTTGAGEWL